MYQLNISQHEKHVKERLSKSHLPHLNTDVFAVKNYEHVN